MKKNVIMAVIAIALLGVGAAGGFFVTNMKSKTVITAMQDRMQKDQADSQERIRGYDMMVNTLNGELAKAQMEIEKYKASAPAPQETPDTFLSSASTDTTPASTGSAQTSTQSAPQQRMAKQTSTTSKTIDYERADGPTGQITYTDGSVRYYVIQTGDSLWTIAQKQLGNGSRFKEILKLNPKISAKSNLVVGSKLKLPAK